MLRRVIVSSCLLMLASGALSGAWAIPVSPDKNTAAPAKKAPKKPDSAAAPAASQLPPNPLLQVIRGARPDPGAAGASAEVTPPKD
jgi:hypothetical protein